MTTSENTAESRGFAETIIGGLIGATIGVLIGLPVANTFSEGGLEAIATALIILFLALCIGAGVGAGIALRVKGRPRPLLTALVSFPAMFIGAYVAVFAATRMANTDVLLLPFVVVASTLALLAARAVVTSGRRSTPDSITEE